MADVEDTPEPKIPLLSAAKLTVTPATGFPQPSRTVAVTRPDAAAAETERAVSAMTASTVNVAVVYFSSSPWSFVKMDFTVGKCSRRCM